MATFLVIAAIVLVGLFVLLMVLGSLAAVVNAFLAPSKQEQTETDKLLAEIAGARATTH